MPNIFFEGFKGRYYFSPNSDEAFVLPYLALDNLTLNNRLRALQNARGTPKQRRKRSHGSQGDRRILLVA